jgi:Fe-S-cluster formation regulator IscX/YfhJ
MEGKTLAHRLSERSGGADERIVDMLDMHNASCSLKQVTLEFRNSHSRILKEPLHPSIEGVGTVGPVLRIVDA